MTRHHHKKFHLKLKSFYIWHRYIGLTVAFFVFVLSITGIMLNHTEKLDLDSKFVHNDLVLDWYGIKAPKESISFQSRTNYVTLLGNHIYLDTKEIPGKFRQLIGATLIDGIHVVAVKNQVLLLTTDGELIERLTGATGVPSGMKRLGLTLDGRLIIEGGHAYYLPDSGFTGWQHWKGDVTQIGWITPSELPEKLFSDLRHHYRGETLPLERVLLDLHSGRILGSWGVYLMDAAAIMLLFLATTGTFLWFQQRRKRKQHLKATLKG